LGREVSFPRKLKRVAKGVLDDLISRRSEYDRYWLFGFLVEQPLDLRIDLLVAPRAGLQPVDVARQRTVEVFVGRLSAASVRRIDLTSAHLTIRSQGEPIDRNVGGVLRRGREVKFLISLLRDGVLYQAERTQFVRSTIQRSSARASFLLTKARAATPDGRGLSLGCPTSPLQQTNATPVHPGAGFCRDAAGCARDSSRPWYARRRPWRSLLNGRSVVGQTDGASTKGKSMHRIHGPYPLHDNWLIKIVDRSTRKATNRVFETRDEADAAVQTLKRQQKHEAGIDMGAALDIYERWLGEVGHKGEGNKPRTVETTMQRLRRFFAEARKIAVGALTPAYAAKLFEALMGAVDSRRNILAEAKTFLRSCRDKGWAKTNALERVQG
jgi:hypothetical protein